MIVWLDKCSLFFGKFDSITKFRLLISNCFSSYGCVLWNVCTTGYVESVCRAWRCQTCMGSAI